MSGERDAATDVVEPELRQATPRPIRIRPKCTINRWATLAMIVMLPGAATAVGFYQNLKWTKLKSAGVETVGTLMDKQDRKSGKKSRAPRGYYRYVVDGNAYRMSENFSDDEFARIPLGHQRPIVYLPDQPSYAATREGLAGSAFSIESIMLWGLAAVVGLTLSGSWIYSEWVRAGRTRLARHGSAATTTSFEVEPAKINSFNKRWKILYTFEHDGRTYSGQGTYRGRSVPALIDGAPKKTILYDPHDPRRNEAYQGVKQWIEVLPA